MLRRVWTADDIEMAYEGQLSFRSLYSCLRDLAQSLSDRGDEVMSAQVFELEPSETLAVWFVESKSAFLIGCAVEAAAQAVAADMQHEAEVHHLDVTRSLESIPADRLSGMLGATEELYQRSGLVPVDPAWENVSVDSLLPAQPVNLKHAAEALAAFERWGDWQQGDLLFAFDTAGQPVKSKIFRSRQGLASVRNGVVVTFFNASFNVE